MSNQKHDRLTASLTIGDWQTIIGYLRAGQYDAVADVIAAITVQLAPQIELAAMADQVRAERKVFATVTGADPATNAQGAGALHDDLERVH